MGNPEAVGALNVADNLDDEHKKTAVENGVEALKTIRQRAAESRSRRLAKKAFDADDSDRATTD